ncbi:hypothetical protein [Pseudomonas guariconensis]|uniref:hypothetical protein n=1 Tax=Pseudomonas guariconensis TaxID=1288410 RepID=UPI003905DD59
MEPTYKTELIESVITEMERVWGPAGFGGEPEAYAWLLENFGITEQDDSKWLDVLSEWGGTLDEDTADLTQDEKDEVYAFLDDEPAVISFLTAFLERYRSSDATYPG